MTLTMNRIVKETVLRVTFILFTLMLAIITACTPPADEGVAIEQLPTRVPSPMPESNNLNDAERVARIFLDAWQVNDYAEMYRTLSPASQQATPFDQFVNTYENAYAEMTFQSVAFNFNGLARDSNNGRVAILDYDATFTTTIVGEFTDTGRDLFLVLEPGIEIWRVAWTRGDLFREMDDGGQLRLQPSVSRRASIYDRNGNVLADQNGRIVTVNVVPQDIPDYEICLNTLATAMDVPREQIEDRINRFGDDWLGEVGTIEIIAYEQWQIELETQCEAQFGSRSARRYPSGDLAPHILGNVGYMGEDEIEAAEAQGFNQDSILGRSGVEASWDEALRGTPGGRLQVVTPDGRTLRVIAESTSAPAVSVYLTLDSGLQQAAIDSIRASYDLYNNFNGNSAGASAIVMDVNTGAILAMVSYPSYDANVLSPFPEIGSDAATQIIQQLEDDSRQPLLNRATQGLYPSGSIFKAITAIAVADSGVYTANQRYVCTGVWQGTITRFDWLPGGHGALDLAGGVANSCNPYFYEAGLRLHLEDPTLLPDYSVRLGLGGNTGLTDITEATGYIGNQETILRDTGYPMTSVDTVSMAIGQGHVSVTPLEMVRFYAGVANGGTLYRPQLVESTRLIDDVSYRMTPDAMSEFNVDPEVLAVVQQGMCDVTTEAYGTAEFVFRRSDLQTLGVCGKTGTAQDQTPNPGPPHAWFVAYAPSELPEVAIIVMVENSGQGSEVAAPIARDILEYYFFGAPETR